MRLTKILLGALAVVVFSQGVASARFLSPDPVGVNGHVDRVAVPQPAPNGIAGLITNPQEPPLELSNYAYVADNPLRWTDPTGEIIPWADPYDTAEWSGCGEQCRDYPSITWNNGVNPLGTAMIGMAAAGTVAIPTAVAAVRACPAPTAVPAVCKSLALAGILGVGICQGTPARTYLRHQETMQEIRAATEKVGKAVAGAGKK